MEIIKIASPYKMIASKSLILLISMFHMVSCMPNYEIEFPEEIPFGTNLIYIDGELYNFKNNSFFHTTFDSFDLLRIAFVQKLASSHVNQLNCSTYFPAESKDYKIQAGILKEPGNIAVAFSQNFDEDLEGWEYQYCASKDDFFQLYIFD